MSTRTSDGKSGISDVLFKYLPYWPVFILFLALCAAGAWYYLRITPPQYEISASIMFKDDSKTPHGERSIVDQLNQLSENRVVENEIEVFQSRRLMQEVVKNLKLYTSFYEKDKFSAMPAYTSSPIQVEVKNPDVINLKDKVEFKFSEKDSSVTIGSKKYPINQYVKTGYGEMRFTANKNYQGRSGKPLYFTLTHPQEVAANLLEGLKASPSTKLTSVLLLEIQDVSPKRGEDILNELIAVYNRISVTEKNSLADSTTALLDARLKEVKDELDEIGKKEQKYKASNSAVEISTQGKLYLESQVATEGQLLDINSQLTSLDQVKKYVTAKESSAGTVPSIQGLKDPILPDLLNKKYQLELEYERLKKTTGENNPMITSVKDQINKITPSLMESIENQKKSLEASRQSLSSSSNNYSSLLHSIPKKELDLIDISREQAIKNNLYAYLLQKKQETELAHRVKTSDTRVIDYAQASLLPVSPRKSMVYGIALVLALCLPIGVLAIKDLFNKKILYRHEIEKLTSAPIIGEIAYAKGKDAIVIQEGRRTFIAEQFRRLRASLGYLGGKSGRKKILVTSSLPKEGKSFVSLNLALSLALTDKRVILLELDLSNPSLSSKLNVKHEKGASNFLQGELEPMDIIKRTAAHKNLFFIPAGTLPENPSELLLTEKLKELFNYLEDVFDVIIIDSAPASLLSDAYVLSPMCDTTMYVVKHDFTPKSYLERLDEDNSSENQLTNMKIVFNGIKSRGFMRNAYGYGYGYGYIHNNSVKVKKRRTLEEKHD
jgi:tyrosine-protein kinase Etk/Wzc